VKPEIVITLAAVAALVASFAYSATSAVLPFVFYPYDHSTLPDAILSNVAEVAFVFAVSLLFFGFSSLLAMFFEGGKLGYLATCSVCALDAKRIAGYPVFDFLMLLPALLAAYAASALGYAALEDYRGRGNIFAALKKSATMVAISLALAIVFAVLEAQA
jgi:hypothetical protein